MKILFLGDIMGRAGRTAITERLPSLIEKLEPDAVILNGENASGGMGLTRAHADSIFEAGADVITLGDHAFDQKDIVPAFAEFPNLIRPINYSKVAPGNGFTIFETHKGKRILVVQVLGQVFMRSPFANPFEAVDLLLKKYHLGKNIDAIFVDMHAEATSEKMAMAIWLDGRVSAVIGTHTHVPTADLMVMPKGTAFQSDAGMCGCYHSVIGMDAEEPLRRFVTGMSKGRFQPAMGDVTLSGVFIEIDTEGRAVKAMPIRDGGHLSQSS